MGSRKVLHRRLSGRVGFGNKPRNIRIPRIFWSYSKSQQLQPTNQHETRNQARNHRCNRNRQPVLCFSRLLFQGWYCLCISTSCPRSTRVRPECEQSTGNVWRRRRRILSAAPPSDALWRWILSSTTGTTSTAVRISTAPTQTDATSDR